MIGTIDRAEIAGGGKLELGSVVQTVGSDGASVIAMIVYLTDDMVTLDSNHPLAARQSSFEIELVGIVSI